MQIQALMVELHKRLDWYTYCVEDDEDRIKQLIITYFLTFDIFVLYLLLIINLLIKINFLISSIFLKLLYHFFYIVNIKANC